MDQRAVKILLDTYWTPAGWKPDRDRRISPDDFRYARSRGVMFDNVRIDHDEMLARLGHAVARLDRRRVADAFLASLSSRRLDLRSALGSFAVFEHLPMHAPVDGTRCATCGLYWQSSEAADLNVLNFERHKWAGVRHDQPLYALLDLELFLREPAMLPSSEDVRIFRELVSAIEAAAPTVTASMLHKCFTGVFKGNKAERDVIVAILGFCGVLETRDHPGYSRRFVPYHERALPGRRFVDMPYPACWWHREAGLRVEALHEYFGHVL